MVADTQQSSAHAAHFNSAVYIAGYGLLITPTHPRDTLTFFVYHQPYRRPLFSHRPRSSLSTPGVRYVYAAEMVPYDPQLARTPTPGTTDASTASSCRRLPSSQA